MASSSEVIFHERQASALCGQHCLNNLLQGSYFTPGDLADIAQELDQQERQMMLELGAETNDALRFLAEDSGNVDESGNFSLQVLSKAVERSHGIQLNNANSELHRGDSDVIATHDAFVLNRSAHWFTIRKIKGRFWDLNSMLDQPQVISEFYLSSMLAQFRNDGYDVFVVTGGPLPEAILEYGHGMGHHYKISDLLSNKTSSSSSNQAQPVVDPWASVGVGQRLNGNNDVIQINDDDDDDDDLAAAIAMSLSQSDGATSSTSQSSSNNQSTQSIATTPPSSDLTPQTPNFTPKRKLPSEPEQGEPAARIMIKACSHVPKLIRKFNENDEACSLFDWVDENWIGRHMNYELIQMNMVLNRHELSQSKKTFSDAGLSPSSALMVKLC